MLIVEDEPSVRRTVEQILRHHGYRVLTAEDGQACLTLCVSTTDPIDLVLTDFAMPRMGGIELATQLRVLRPQTQVLFMSGFADTQFDAVTIERLGGIELIAKPFRATELLERLRRLLPSS